MIDVYGFSITTVPIIAAAVYGIVEFLKSFVFQSVEKFRKYIPVFACLLGGVISIIVFMVSPELVPATNWYTALIIGCASGLSAVGINQIKKQAEKMGGGENGS